MKPSIQDVRAALDTIVDPCSTSAGVPLGLVEMGLVEHIDTTNDGRVTVKLRLTSPGCMLGVLVFEPDVKETVGRLAGVVDVRVQFGDPLTWTETDISEQGRRRLQDARTQSAIRMRLEHRASP